MMSGVAILMMLVLHLFSFPTWYLPEVSWDSPLGNIGNKITLIISEFGGICVTLYAMMTGYSLIVSSQSYNTFKKRLLRLLKFLSSYWLACIIFIIYGYTTDNPLPTLQNFMLNLIGVQTGPTDEYINVSFGWYVTFYIEFILICPVLVKIFSTSRLYIDILSIISIIILVFCLKKISSDFIKCTPFIACCSGIIVAKYDIFTKLHNRITSHFSTIILLTLIATLVLVRMVFVNLHTNGGRTWLFIIDCSYSIFAIILTLLCTEYFHRKKNLFIIKVLRNLGILSMYIWFIHGIMYSGNKIIQPYIYAAKEPIVIFLSCLIFVMPLAMIFKYLDSKIIPMVVHIFKKASSQFKVAQP